MKQELALKLMKAGHNVYLGGSAGAGKTHVLNEFIQHLDDQMVQVGITASTGIAATHLGGVTIHSWSGFGIKTELSDEDLANIKKKHYLRKRIKEAEVLIIDEISMLSGNQLDMVDQICRAFRRNPLPFGGLQVILSGDFFQLPPIAPRGQRPNFVFESRIWSDMDLKICYLTESHRHEDPDFLQILNEIRSNSISEYSVEKLEAQRHAERSLTRLYTHNANVDAINQKELEKLSGRAYRYGMRSSGKDFLVNALKKNCLAPEILTLKKGAMVMFIKNNFDAGYANGTLGTVVGFESNNAPIVKTFDGKEISVKTMSWELKDGEDKEGSIQQLPLTLAWAITIHKSQGMSLDAAEIDLSRSFVYGMGYVALSRVRSLEGIRLLGMNQMSLSVDPGIIELDAQLRRASELVESGLTE